MTRAASSWKGVCVRVQGRLELVLCGVAGVEASCRWTWSSSCCSGVGMQGSSDAAFLVVGLVSLGLEAEMDGDFWRARSSGLEARPGLRRPGLRGPGRLDGAILVCVRPCWPRVPGDALMVGRDGHRGLGGPRVAWATG